MYSASLELPQISNQSSMERADREPETANTIKTAASVHTMRTRNTGASTSGSRVPHERGYRKLATFMTKVDDVVIFRRFSKLNMLNLLRLQAELASLELSYEAACNIDDNSKDSQERGFTQSFYELREFGQISPGSQLELLDRINDTLHKYNSALLQVSQVLRLDKPDRYDLERLHEWLRDKDQGALFLHTPEEEIWGKLTGSDAKTNTSDQVTLIQRESGFSRGVILTLVSLYDLIWGRHRKKTKRVDVERNQTYYPESNVRAAAKVLTSVLASLFPGIVILALYLIDTTLKRIGAMLCFTTFFAFVLSYWTSAKTIEVFAATAGFVAVEVVFIGSASTK
ncbi:hypothetical protein BofuT4_P142530.1 [Botrytis cinerea T4]|uniref:DUF6594 domain-containing protein n=1 Tax=Botryotinia fuckeliana (strain T4) TaxID=999810 RepID=G2YZE3_BOTF4|nr:hypothetical protein BofuT4_P142530.1 [Botrytis cinerea T4]